MNRLEFLVIISLVLTTFIANRAMNTHYSEQTERVVNSAIWINEEAYFGGCVKGRQGATQSFLKTCTDLTTDSLLRDQLTVRMDSL